MRVKPTMEVECASSSGTETARISDPGIPQSDSKDRSPC